MPARPAFSVVVPCYNAGPYLARAVRSTLSQPGAGELEVIIADDVSTDGSLAEAKALAAADPRIRVVRNAVNMGPGGTRNAAIAAATGEWIALLDADDAFAEGRLAQGGCPCCGRSEGCRSCRGSGRPYARRPGLRRLRDPAGGPGVLRRQRSG